MAYKPCKYLNTEGRKRITKNDFFECTIEVLEPVLPMSITKTYNYSWPFGRTLVSKKHCAECKFMEPIE